MPVLRCIDEECGHRWTEKSHLAEGAECEACGGETRLVGGWDGPPPEMNSVEEKLASERSHPAHARKRARKVLVEFGIHKPFVVPHSIAARSGLTVVDVDTLGSLRARLVGTTIEINASESANGQRFSVAHELGHHFLGTKHGDSEHVESEADAFAGELLVPGHMLKAEMQRTTDRETLRRVFKVGQTTLEIAARHHKLFDRLTG